MLLVAMAFAGCHRDGLTHEQRAVRHTATEAIEAIMEGRYADFVEDIAYVDEMNDSYRAEFADVLADYIASLNHRNGGITSVTAVADSIVGDEAQVFLLLQFADSTSEEIAFPLVRRDEKWRIK